ncbi:MAG: KTSC domain-containing protein [Sphingomonas sp.]|nr:KTSC domain-containing protein [Sphingomonas sp.]
MQRLPPLRRSCCCPTGNSRKEPRYGSSVCHGGCGDCRSCPSRLSGSRAIRRRPGSERQPRRLGHRPSRDRSWSRRPQAKGLRSGRGGRRTLWRERGLGTLQQPHLGTGQLQRLVARPTGQGLSALGPEQPELRPDVVGRRSLALQLVNPARAIEAWAALERLRLVPSTVICRFDYSPEREELVVEFVTGRRYLYSGVPAKATEAMLSAFAKGVYFNRNIRDRYDCVELV